MVARFHADTVAARPEGPLVLEGGAPVPLPPGAAWQVADGVVEAYLVWSGGRRLLAVVEEGGVAFPVPEGSGSVVHLVTAEGARLLPAPADADLAGAADHWVHSVSGRLAGGVPQDPEVPEGTLEVADGTRLVSRHGVRWIAPAPGMPLDLCGAGEMVLAPDLAAVTGPLWAAARGRGEVTVRRTAGLSPAQLLPAVSALTEALATVFDTQARAADALTVTRLNTDPAEDHPGDSATAVRQVAASMGLKPEDLPTLPTEAEELPLPALCRVAGLRARAVMLEEDWHARDQGPLIARLAEEDAAGHHALIWDGRGYRDPAGRRLTARRAERYAHLAHTISAPLPARVTGL